MLPLLLALLSQPVPTGGATIDNTEIPTPTDVKINSRLVVPPYTEASETAGMYCKLEHDNPASAVFPGCLYFENDANQHQAGGAPIKILQRGNGDAVYVAIIGDNSSGYGYEAAMFGGWANAPTDTVTKQENGYIATFQWCGLGNCRRER